MNLRYDRHGRRVSTDESAQQPAARTTLDALAFAANLVTIARKDGIEVGSVSIYGSGDLLLMPEDASLAPALAVSLGLTTRWLRHDGYGRASEHFEGAIDGVYVSTQHTLPLSALDDADRIALGVAA